MKEKDLKFYESYKPLPTTSRKRITTFRKELFRLTLVSKSCSYLSSKQPVKFQFSTPVLRSQEGRKIGKMSMFDRMKATAATSKQVQFPTPKKPAKEVPSEPKQITRMTISKKKLEKNAIIIKHMLAYKEEKLYFQHSPTCDSKKYSQAMQANLLANKKKVEEKRLKNKSRKAVKYLVAVATKHKAILRTIDGEKKEVVKDNNKKIEENQVLTDVPNVISHGVGNRNLPKHQGENKDTLEYKTPNTLPRAKLHRVNKKEKKRRNTAVESQGSLLNALEEIALEPIRVQP